MSVDKFKNLKPKKQKAILDAIRACIINCDYDSFCISNVIKEADISRGSFYNYFTDKYDAVYTYICYNFLNAMYNFKEIVTQNNGDIFVAVQEFYNVICENVSNFVDKRLLHNMNSYSSIFLNIMYSDEYSKQIKAFVLWLVENTIIGKENIVDESSMSNLVEILMSVLSHELIRFFISKNDKNIENFNKKINIIKLGVYNNKK